MEPLFIDRLIAAVRDKRSPICVGMDPILDSFPAALKPKDARDLDACVDAVFDFCSGALKAVAPIAPVVKFQSAYFEKFLWQGVEAYYSLVQEAKSLGLLVIGDVKRGDIGSTSEAYAAAHLADLEFHGLDDAATPDAITLNPYLGLDTLEPFLQVCRDEAKGVFVLVRTSNPGSKDLQDQKMETGETLSEMLAGKLQTLAAAAPLMGQHGYSNLGAVVGATQSHTMQSLRQRLPSSYFLLPGYGTQGATADMTRAAFDERGLGALVSASRSVLYPKSAGPDWQSAIAAAAETMRSEVAAISGLA
ncbi:MAG: orotidine-5'-phosphate decarboxylase [Tepidisphaeraceae bacterium]